MVDLIFAEYITGSNGTDQGEDQIESELLEFLLGVYHY